MRPVYFPTTNGQMEWSAPDGSIHSASFDDRLDAARTAQRLRTALSLEGEWLPTVLRTAHARLIEVRSEQPDAGGLVIATDQEHARGIAALLRTRFGTSARVVTSDDPQASAGIADFAAGSEPWFELLLAPPPLLAGGGDVGTALLTRQEEKRELRDANAKVARELVRRTRMAHGQVNAELNRLSRVRKVSEATIDELERRLATADRWLAKT